MGATNTCGIMRHTLRSCARPSVTHALLMRIVALFPPPNTHTRGTQRFSEGHSKLREVIVVLGGLGTGRHELARNISRQLYYSIHINFDDVRKLHLKSRTERGPMERALTFDNNIMLIKNYVAHGYYNIVWEGCPPSLVSKWRGGARAIFGSYAREDIDR